jgi:hypothetical protein
MGDYFDNLIYLVVGIIYLVISNAKNRKEEDKKLVADRPSERLPAPTASTGESGTWRHELQETPVRKPWLHTSILKVPPRPIHSTTSQPAGRRPSVKKIDRVRYRYGGWKKAIIMGEVIRRHS